MGMILGTGSPSKSPYFPGASRTKMKTLARALCAVLLLSVDLACDDPAPPPEPPPRDQAILAVKDYVGQELDALAAAAEALQDAAPTHVWTDAERATLRERWHTTRDHYERIEGAVAMLFPQFDRSVDDRYEGFVERARDPDPFDGEGVTGMHAIERILWAGEHSEAVRAFEARLHMGEPARAPATDDEARAFKEGLLDRLVRDCATMRDQFEPLALDPAAAYRGVLGSIEEQLEKVNLGGTGEAESRYARRTLADMRENLAGGRAIVDALSPWLEAQEGGPATLATIRVGFDRLEHHYDRIEGPALPAIPEGWPRRIRPSEAQLATEFGQLWLAVRAEADPDDPTSLLSAMVVGAEQLDIAVRPRALEERLPRPE